MTPQRKRAFLIAGIIGGVILIGYVFLKGRSGATATGGAGSAAPPVAPSSGSSGDSNQGGTDAAALLAALAGENQKLLSSLLNSTSGLISLAGSPVGSPASPMSSSGSALSSEPLVTQPVSQPFSTLSESTTPMFESPTPYVAPSYEYQGQTVTPVTYESLGVQPSAITESMVAPPLPEPQVQPLLSGSASLPSLATQADVIPQSVSGSFDYSAPWDQYAFSVGTPGPNIGYDTSQITTHEKAVQAGGGGNLAA